MDKTHLVRQIFDKKSFLCVGLDSDIEKIPAHLRTTGDPLFEFNRQIIDATASFCVAYKLNTAFYEALGSAGWESLKKTIAYIPKDHFIIADAKRGDIGNTSDQYAKAFFHNLNADAITISPYMGNDSVQPFLRHEGKWVILLALTSNPGSSDFQFLESKQSGKLLFEEVITKSLSWDHSERLMFVVGATQADQFKKIRSLASDHFFLVPGVGAQSGDLESVVRNGINKDCGLLVNASRSIIYASSDKDFAKSATHQSKILQSQMNVLLDKYLS